MYITLHHDYTVNGVVRWAKGVAHEANDELRRLLADGIAGVEHLFAHDQTPAAAAAPIPAAAPPADFASVAEPPAAAPEAPPVNPEQPHQAA